jgi:hypothetical protein
MEDIRIKLSALWVARMLTGLLGDVIRFFESGIIQGIIDGNIDGMQLTDEMLLGMAILMQIPIVMVFLVLTLEVRINRWANIIVAICFFGLDFVGLSTYTSSYAIFSVIVSLVFCALIVWYAWKWPTQEK